MANILRPWRSSSWQVVVGVLVVVLLATACAPRAATPPAVAQRPSATPVAATATPSPTTTPSATSTPSPTLTPSATSTPSPTAMPSQTATATLTATATATPDPYAALTIEALRGDTYGDEGDIEVGIELPGGEGFRRYRITFPSDGLRIDGFMNVPTGDGPFPVVIVNHGYMPTGSYDLLTYTAGYADAYAQAGFLTIHPSYRNHRGSDTGENPWRIGYARDVMNLVVMARRLPQADGQPVGLWGHSMGGGISLRVLAVMPDQLAGVVLYGAMSGEEARNYEAIIRWTGGMLRPGTAMPVAPADNPALYAAISPINFLDGVTVPVQIHHGAADDVVPPAWSEALAERLAANGTPYDLFLYPGGPHNLAGADRVLLTERTIAFFQTHLIQR